MTSIFFVIVDSLWISWTMSFCIFCFILLLFFLLRCLLVCYHNLDQYNIRILVLLMLMVTSTLRYSDIVSWHSVCRMSSCELISFVLMFAKIGSSSALFGISDWLTIRNEIGMKNAKNEPEKKKKNYDNVIDATRHSNIHKHTHTQTVSRASQWIRTRKIQQAS